MNQPCAKPCLYTTLAGQPDPVYCVQKARKVSIQFIFGRGAHLFEWFSDHDLAHTNHKLTNTEKPPSIGQLQGAYVLFHRIYDMSLDTANGQVFQHRRDLTLSVMDIDHTYRPPCSRIKNILKSSALVPSRKIGLSLLRPSGTLPLSVGKENMSGKGDSSTMRSFLITVNTLFSTL